MTIFILKNTHIIMFFTDSIIIMLVKYTLGKDLTCLVYRSEISGSKSL